MIKKLSLIIVLCFLGLNLNSKPLVKLARLHYFGGGDWYNDTSIIPNLANFINQNLGSKQVNEQQAVVKATEAELNKAPFIFVTGHGKINFNQAEVDALRKYMLAGGFLYIDDDYGLDKHIRQQLKKIFPEYNLQELSKNHKIFNCWFKFKNGLPKIHKHDEKRPQAFGLFNENGKMMAFYTYESNISDGWAEQKVHNNPEEIRQKALKMGMNIVIYALTN